MVNMAFYRNLKIILDEKGISNYEAAIRCEMDSQTIDNIINKKVMKPKIETLEKLAKGLEVTVNKLVYGSDCFVYSIFEEHLRKSGMNLEELIINSGADPMPIVRGIIPPKIDQERIAACLNMPVEKIFVPSRIAEDIYRSSQSRIKPYQRPDINSDPATDDSMAELYKRLSPMAKRLVYNLAYDLAKIETENIVSITSKDYWEKDLDNNGKRKVKKKK